MKILSLVYQRYISEGPLLLGDERSWCYFLYHGAAQIDGMWGEMTFDNTFLALLRPGQHITVTPLDKKGRYDILIFEPENDEEQLLRGLPLPISPTVPPNIYELSNRLRIIEEVYYSANKYRHGINNADFMILIYATASGDEDTPKGRGSSRPMRQAQMRRLRVLIFDDPQRFRSTENGAKYMRLSNAYFCNLYKKQFGTTFVSDCIHARIKRCCTLLASTDYTIKDIAKKLGYENEAFFYHQFKQTTGVTPDEFRRNPRKMF